MDFSFADITPPWDLSQATTFSQLADDDFLALLQKQFPTTTSPSLTLSSDFATSVDPNDISRFSLPSFNPPSQDSSPSPPRDPGSANRGDNDDDMSERGGSDLKRKASVDDDDDFEEGPSSKQTSKKGGRRKSGGGPDESRLLKRKEQNRAAQRAFRERKEKHVKDLEDKVASLEQRNEQATSENQNLRDLLTRLQSENMALKQGSFTFQVPKNVGSASSTPSSSAMSPPESSSLSPSFSRNSTRSGKEKEYTNPLDLSSLQAFDPSMLDLLENDPAAPATATDGASSMDFGFNREGGYLTSHFTTIASNPAFFSLASMWDTPATNNNSTSPGSSSSPPVTNANTNNNTNTNNSSSFFDMQNLSSWAAPTDGGDSGTLDDLFGYLNPSGGMESMTDISPSSAISPIVHQQSLNAHSPSNSTSTSSGSPSSDGLFGTPRDGMSSASESENGHEGGTAKDTCPKTRDECSESITGSGMSPFVTGPSLARKEPPSMPSPFGVVACQGTSSFPRTPKNDQNIEVLSAWRSITSNPNFKDCDINELCTEFSNKARCDGTKVVLEPAGVNSILSHLSTSAKHRP